MPSPDDAKGQEIGSAALQSIAGDLLEQLKREKAQRERERSKPSAVAEREESKDAFAAATSGEAKVLARERFAAAMSLPLEPGPTLKAGEKVDRYVGDTWAQIDRGADKAPTFARSMVPMLAKDAQGERRPVDFELRPTDDGAFAPANPLVDLEIARSPADGVVLERSGVRISPVVEGATKVEPQLDGSRVFWADVAPDLDYFVTPTVSGFESFVQVRSEAAPEQFAYRISVPEGARLRDTGTSDGVEVVHGEDKDAVVIARVGVPFATDADGEPIRVSYVLDGDVMTLTFAHRGEDLLYPLLVDPPIEEEYDFSDPHAWGWNYAQAGTGGTLTGGFGGFGLGIMLNAVGTSFPAGRSHNWYWQAPGNSFIYMVDFGFVDHAPSMPTDPSVSDWATMGILNMAGGGWEPGAQSKTPSGTIEPSPWSTATTMTNKYLTHCQRMPDCTPGTPGSPAGTPGNRAALYQWWVVAGPSVGNAYVAMQESRIKVADFTAPGVTGLSRTNPLTGWVDETHGPQVDQVTFTGTDGGLGVAGIELDDDAGRVDADDDGTDDDSLDDAYPGEFGCDGTFTGGGGPCPAAFTPTAPLAYSTDDLDDGITTMRAKTIDAVGNVGEQTWQVKLDKGNPVVSLDDPAAGDLYERRGTTLTPGSHRLYVHATDGSTGSPATRRSGVTKVEVFLGYPGQTSFERVAVPFDSACPADSCSANVYWDMQTSQVAGGPRTVRVVVTDAVGNREAQQFDVTVPPSATLVSPGDGTHTSKLVPLQVKADIAGLTHAQLQYRRPLGMWQNIPATASQLTDANGAAVGSSNRPFPTATVGATTALVRWDVPLGFGLAQADGPLEFRAVVTGGPGGVTQIARVTVDQRGLSGENAREEIEPGAVDLVTGNFAVSEEDVAIDAGLQTLAFARTFNSRDPSTVGPLGPGWVASTPIEEAASVYKAISEVNDPILGSYTKLVDFEGISIYFYPIEGGGFEPEPGEENLALTKLSATQYELRDSAGNRTVFERQTGAVEFSPVLISAVGTQNTSSIIYQVRGGKPFPKRIVAPAAPGVNCSSSPTTTRGCRTLDFIYAPDSGTNASPATGTSEGQWGSFADRLDNVRFTAWNPATGGMWTDIVAQYNYDSTGKLRAAWDYVDTPVKKTKYAYDTGGRLDVITPPGEASWDLGYTQLAGDSDGGRLTSVTRLGTPQGDAKTSVVYRVPVSGLAAPYPMGAADVGAWGQTNDVPADATAVFEPDIVPVGSIPTQGEYERSTIHYTDAAGREVNIIDRGGAISTTEYDARGNITRELSPTNRQRAMNLGSSLSAQEAQLLDVERTYNADGTEVLSELGPRRSVRLSDGQLVSARSNTVFEYDAGVPPSVNPKPHLPTKQTAGAKVIGGADMVDARVTQTVYDWALRKPTSVTIDPGSQPKLNLKHQTFYDPASGLTIGKRKPISPNGGNLSSRQILYYTAGAPAGHDSACTNRPEWAYLRCKVKPGSQTVGAVEGLPEIAVETYTYNRFNQPLTKTETVGSSTRVTSRSYDNAGRVTAESMSSNVQARPGLVAAYGFNEGAGTVVTDVSGKNNPGTVSGATWTAAGKYGGALQFDGVNDYVNVPEGRSLVLSDAMTVSAWVKPDVASGKRTIVGKQSNGQGIRYGLYSHSSSGGPSGERRTTTTAAASSTSPLPTATWSHVAVTYDGQNLKLFVNGVLKTTQAATGDMWGVGGPLRIGGHGLASEYFDGLIDDVRIYDRPLSGIELWYDKQYSVQYVMNPNENAAEDTTLVAGYGFEETAGTTAFDMSGNGNDATANGGMAWAPGAVTAYGASFDATDDYAATPDTELLDLTNQMTLEAQVKIDTLPAAGQRRTILAKPGSYYLQVNSSGQWVFGIDPTGAQSFAAANEVTAPGPTLGQWTYVAGALSGNGTTGTQLQLWTGTFGNVNQVATKTISANAKRTSAPLRIGAYDPGTARAWLMDGMIDEPRIWNRALPEAELDIHALYPGNPYGIEDGGTPIRTTTYEYSSTTGRQTKVSSTATNNSPIVNETIYDNVGRPITYKDADGNTATTTYDIAGRVDVEADGKGSQNIDYDPITGLATSLIDSHAGTFAAEYDLDGNVIEKTYPGGLRADLLRDEEGSATSLVYTKSGVWFSDQVEPSIHGQWMRRDTSLSDQSYTYDAAGRLTGVADTTPGQGCKTRTYTYDANSNRQMMKTYGPGSGGACTTTTTPTIQTSFSDFADRSFAAGFVHDTFSRVTTVPSAHAGGSALRTTYYLNDMVRTQTQGGVTKGYLLDADKQRYRSTLPNGPSREVYHYNDDSDSPAWTAQTTNGTVTSWDRNVYGLDGSVAAVATNNGSTTTVTLQLENLHGDITATAGTSSTSPDATYESDEFGVPKSGAAGTYRWHGGEARQTRFSSGIVQMGVRSYVPSMGRFISPDPIQDGSANAYDYAYQDPVNGTDPNGCGPLWSCIWQCAKEECKVADLAVQCGAEIANGSVRSVGMCFIRHCAGAGPCIHRCFVKDKRRKAREKREREKEKRKEKRKKKPKRGPQGDGGGGGGIEMLPLSP